MTQPTTSEEWKEELKEMKKKQGLEIEDRGEDIEWVAIQIYDETESFISKLLSQQKEELLREIEKNIEIKIGEWFDKEWNKDLERLKLYGSPEGMGIYIQNKNGVVEAVKEYILPVLNSHKESK